MTTKTNKISPLEELRMEKASLKQECAKKEAALEEHWNYLSENAGSLLIGCAVSNVKRSLGLAPVRTKIKERPNAGGKSPESTLQNILGIAKSSFPMLWEVIQPMLVSYVMRKIKDRFFGKKRK